MRTGLLLGATLVVGLVLYGACVVPAVDRASEEALAEHAREALDVACPDEGARATRECRRTLTRLYLAGTLDPDTTLRSWCLRRKESRWGGPPPAIPRVCRERFGGWPTD